MDQDDFADIDTKTSSSARGYDYMLGGADNYAADRVAVEHFEDVFPGTKSLARNNRRFMERVVHYLARECGIRQFIDNGSGLPTQNNVHQIAQSIAPESRVVYIDNDPMVQRHQKVNALTENDNTAFILADSRNVDEIVDHPDMARLVNLDEPAAALYMSFLHFMPDEGDPWGMVRSMTNRLAPGSYLVISHVASDDPDLRQRATDLLLELLGGNFGRVRTTQEVRAFFEDLELVEPGLVDVRTWRPDGREEEQTHDWMEFGGVAHKPRKATPP